LIFTSLLAGCDTPPTRGTFPKLTYAYLTPFRLASAASISSMPIARLWQAPNVEQSFPVSPSGTAAQWGRDRLIAVGGPDRAVYTVLRGDAIETHLAIPDSGGMFSDFDNPQSERYDLTIGVRLQIIEPDGRVAASVEPRRPAARPSPRTPR
jgi:hypothetical protein